MTDFLENGQLEFRVKVCDRSSSRLIQSGIWDSQHICVTDDPEEYFSDTFKNDVPLSEAKCGEAIIKHQLKVEHFGVLRQAFIKFKCYGFPHSTMQQITRHQDTAPLVTSMRYTGEKFIRVSLGSLPVDRAFYVRPPGIYKDRSGRSIDWHEEDKLAELEFASKACDRYAYYVLKRNMPYEMAREFLPFCYRQPFVLAGTVESFFHWEDQRSKQNSEREIRVLAQMCMEEFKAIAPELHNWYLEHRWAKARLAP